MAKKVKIGKNRFTSSLSAEEPPLMASAIAVVALMNEQSKMACWYKSV